MQPLHAVIDQAKAPQRPSRFTIDLAVQTSHWFCKSLLLKQLRADLVAEPDASGL